jgi:murein DD-endopeptidase MepM/ murein hydrolase activator NlpD
MVLCLTVLWAMVLCAMVPCAMVLCAMVPPGAIATSASSSGVSAVAARDADTTAPWAWPTGTRVVGRPWEAPADDYAAGHRGIDVPAELGADVSAVDGGTVAFAGAVGGRQVVTVDHGDGLVSTLDSVAPAVAAGDVVARGDVVGTVSVGHCPATAPCLHLGARVDGRYVDPTPYLPAAEWPVLLPETAWTD